MADRGRGRGRGFQQQSFPNSGRGRGGAQDRGGGRGGGSPNLFRQNGQVFKPSEVVRKLEDDSFQQDLTASLQKLNIKAEAPLRPAYGTRGKTVTLWANYFELIPKKDQPFNRYAVDLLSDKGEEPKGKKRERLLRLLLGQLPPNIAIASDYKSTILSAQTLGFTSKEFLVTYFSETESAPSDKSPKYRAKVIFTGTLTFATLLDYLSSSNLTQEKPAVKEEIIQATNIVLGHGLKSNTKIITKKNKYFPGEGNLMEKWILANGLEAFRGFFMSVRAATGRILLNVQVQHIAVWEFLPLTVLLDRFRREGMSLVDVSRAISGLWITVSHLKNRLKRIAGLASPAEARGNKGAPQVPSFGAGANQVKFWKDTLTPPRYVTVAEHFKQAHNTQLQVPNAPLVNVGTRKDPIYLPAEVCHVKKHQDFQKKLSPEATSAMIGRGIAAVRAAPDNARTISGNGMALLQENSAKTLEHFGVKVSTSMVTVNARVLSGVSLEYNGKLQQPRDASWNMRDIKFSKPVKLPSWSYVWIRAGNNGGAFRTLDEVTSCVKQFAVVMGKCGITVGAPVGGKELKLNSVHDPAPEIDQFFGSFKTVQLVLVILPSQSTTIYNAIKTAADVKHGVHTINVVGDKKKFAKAMTDDNSQYFANVALKFNLKLGGQNQLLRNADLGFVSEGKTMLVGLDVTHPAPGSSESAPSVSGITASIDAKLGQWPADVAIQKGRQEMIAGLQGMFKSRLQLWQRHNQQKLPEEIIIYRDGVGETMYDLVRTTELPQIRAACREVYPAPATKIDKPYITIVICGKRHNTRFYPTNENEADARTGGTKSGTIVDRGITEARIWDFYLQAHTALQGTPKSAHYVVVHDEIFRRRAAAAKKDGRTSGQRAADDLESLTHNMCYMFGRATKAVSLCPPAYYADLVCDRARRWLSRIFDERTVVSSEDGCEARPEDVKVHDKLKDSMFYI